MSFKEEIFLVMIGAAIGFISSIGTTIVTELMKKRGQIKIYYKIVYSKVRDRGTWGFHHGSEGLVFEVPLWVELHNTSNTVRVIRDLNILLYKDGKQLTQMTQINKAKDTLYGNEGAYSFVLEPRSLKKYDLHFAIKNNEIGVNFQFDEIRLRYFDEGDKVHIFSTETIEQCWELGNLERDGAWKLAR